MFLCWRIALAGTLFSASGLCGYAQAQTAGQEVCPRPLPNGVIAEPEELRSEQGTLSVDLAFRNQLDEQGRMRYCYVDKNGNESPTLRLRPGDLLVLRLKNDLKVLGNLQKNAGMAMKHAGPPGATSSACTDSQGGALSTNLHFHGLSIAPDCHQDDVLHTSLQPTDAAYEFRFRVPPDQPPGLYWYHPHLHGLTREQVVGGASGALIVEGIETDCGRH
jgi:FtsP/CotA-like multicopper oxidase with cupredoxin domain